MSTVIGYPLGASEVDEVLFWSFWKMLSSAEAFGRESHSLWMVWCEDMGFVTVVAVLFYEEPTHVQDWSLVGMRSSPNGSRFAMMSSELLD